MAALKGLAGKVEAVELARLANIRPHVHTWSRLMSLYGAHLDGHADALPPVQLGYSNDGRVVVVDGMHRIAAARRFGVGSIRVQWLYWGRRGGPESVPLA